MKTLAKPDRVPTVPSVLAVVKECSALLAPPATSRRTKRRFTRCWFGTVAAAAISNDFVRSISFKVKGLFTASS
jgi:hypothetical protein